MDYVGKYVGFRPKLFITLCRMFKKLVKQHEKNKVIVDKLKELTKKHLVPANGYAQGNGPMAIELYSYLETFDYHFRYECYQKVYKQGMTGSPYVARIF